ncbi:MAG: DEAD/DEAH box helicase [Deltaproteobacteria bacterium]|nr:MAG: DEAD/DEAH box helicase [Deltaproteobacteria bacterium]
MDAPFTEIHDAVLRHLEATQLWKITQPSLTKAGIKLFRSGRVEGIGPTEGGLLASQIRGKNGRRYEPTFGLDGDPARSDCNCGRRDGCEHIVAAVMAARANAALWRHQLAHAPAPEQKPAGGPATVPTERTELDAWGKEHGVADLLRTIPELFVAFLTERASRHLAMVNHLRWSSFGLADVLVGRAGFRSPKELVAQAGQFLLARAAARARFFAEVRAESLIERPPTDTRLAPHLADVRRQRSDLLGRGVLPRPHDERGKTLVDILLDPVRIRVQEDHRHYEYERPPLVIELTPAGEAIPSTDRWARDDVRLFEALDYAGVALTARENASLARQMADDLSRETWERVVGDLRSAFAPVEDAPPDFELGWRLTLGGYNGTTLAPVECRQKVRGGWKTKQIKGASAIQAMDTSAHPGDATALQTMRLAADSHRYESANPLILAIALPALVGHPRFFVKDGKERHVRLKRAQVALATRDVDGGLRLGFDVDGRFVDVGEVVAAAEAVAIDDAMLLIDEDSATLCPLSRELEDALANAARRKLRDVVVPEDGVGTVAELARDVVGRMPLSLSEGLRGPTAPADAAIRVRLTLGAEGLEIRAVVVPAPELASEVPGEGTPELYVVRDGALIVLRRDLARERHDAMALLDALGIEPTPAFAHVEAMGDAALDVVHALGERPEVPVEWATEERVAVSRGAVGFDALAIEARKDKGRSWFTMHGAAETRGGGAVPLAELLRAIRERKRYVRVDDGSWARIDDAVSAKLAAIAKRDGKVPQLMAPLVGELEEAGATLQGFAELSNALERLRRARGLVVATPAGLEAELRSYQREGFQWLARLAEWAPGACLADDMGLGKTVQALALLLHRRQTGPALVVAPTSLGFNWVREAERFAPSLRLWPVRSGAELAALGPLGAGDVVVTSYGLVARHVEVLAGTTWGTLVADEAQAVKNAGTQRAKALRQLEAGFTLALTGTPVENRTTELWSLFRLIAPGLLGSEDGFREEYAAPIERGDVVARSALAGLVAPFVLRRLKRDVARELPERTEVALGVVLRKAERARYEEIRRATLDLLEGGGGQKAGFAALQALTRLRQVACHPALVDPGWTHGSAKLDALMELLERLAEEGHRALVFSQFTSFLALVRERLDAASTRYLYLDGQTPAAARQGRVDAFQAGEAEVFLLSLKAGGTGLNLTAATYVIHLDPWWNPAVEDQATDRAHRIGQDQPVTVYRLIAKDTVEEGIVTLHADKRELADALLAGSGSSASLSYEEMVALIGGHATPEVHVDEDEDENDGEGEGEAGGGADDSAPARVIDLSAARAKRARAAAQRPESGPAPPDAPPAPIEATPTGVLGAFESALAAAVATGDIKSSTAANYRSAARRLIAFAEARGLDARRPETLDAFVRALERGAERGGKSTRLMVRAAFRWFPQPEG